MLFRSEAHALGVVVVGEGKAVEALEPAVIGVATVAGFDQFKHGVTPWQN